MSLDIPAYFFSKCWLTPSLFVQAPCKLLSNLGHYTTVSYTVQAAIPVAGRVRPDPHEGGASHPGPVPCRCLLLATLTAGPTPPPPSPLPHFNPRCLLGCYDHQATPQLETVTLQPAASDTVTI